MTPDLRILSEIAEHRTAPVTWLADATMDVGTHPVVLAVLVIAGSLVMVGMSAYRQAIAVVLAIGVSFGVARWLKSVVERPRPPRNLALVDTGGSAMPSTHAAWTLAAAVAFVVATTWASRRTRTIAWVVALLLAAYVGFCMVYVGAHWASDVLAGWVLGGVVGAASGRLARRFVP